MENSDAQPDHDVTNIKHRSRLPFTAPKENSIRLFGKEFGGSDPTITTTNDSSAPATDTVIATTTSTFIHNEVTKEYKKSQRIFECQYCNRNFSTSQALGGHQNAHRRERLHTKRTHNKSIAIHDSSKPQLHSYPQHANHLLIATTSPSYLHHSSTRNIINYNNNCYNFYAENASYTTHQTPIYGRPFEVLKFPTAVQKLTAIKHGLLNYSGSSSRSLYMHESKPSFDDQVSLDLHL